ncbi:hypothetical protein [Lachnospira multipara]|uniref:hypothetical protein n=1 Tax=Lachnospira multipara TaxID=28051 RepID=UPI0004806355|nr:hypothetical protein [Lachnospira multipara]
MAEIVVDIECLGTEINKLNELKNKITSNKKGPTGVVGGGNTVSNIENIGNKFKDIEDKMEVLVQSTVSFMDNIKTSYTESDNNAANTVK